MALKEQRALAPLLLSFCSIQVRPASTTALDFFVRAVDLPPMRRLVLLRHAKSDRGSAGLPDIARPLNARGKEAAARIGAYMAKHDLVPDQVLCSTAQRTRDTWDSVAKAFTTAPPVLFEKRLYAADPEKLFALIRDVSPDTHTVMIIGHNPELHDLAETLIAAGDIEQRATLHDKFPTGALVVIDFAVDSWADVHPHGGRLDRFISPRSLGPDTA
jgi:phosphohistidine phosphatase